jgi:hypothetical protein
MFMIVRVLAVVLLVGASSALPAGVRAEPVPQSPEERQRLEQRVEQLEREFQAAREEALALCRGGWTSCTNNRCKKIARTEASRWQACQNDCDATYERCQKTAESIWPDQP